MNINDLDIKDIQETEDIVDLKPDSDNAPIANLSDFDIKDIEEVDQDEKMDMVEALSRMGISGATLGFAPIAGGAGEVGKVLEDFASPSGAPATYKGMPMGKPKSKEEIRKFKDYSDLLSQLKEAYYKGRDETIEKEKEAIEDYPVLGTGALIAGSIPTTIATGGLAGGGRVAQLASKVLPKAESLAGLSTAAKAGKMAKEGFKAGALTGFGSGEAKLLEGDVLGTLEETFESGIGGGVFGSLFPVGGKAISGTAKAGKGLLEAVPGVQSAITGLQAGRRGINVTNKGQIADFIRSSSEKIRSDILELFPEEKASELTKQMDEQGIRIFAKGIIGDIKKQLKSKSMTAEESVQKKQFLENLERLDSEFNKIGDEAFEKLDYSSLKVSEIDRMQEKVADKYKKYDSYEKEVVAIATDLQDKLRKAVDEGVASTAFSEKRAQSNKVLNILDSLGINKNTFYASEKNDIAYDKVIEKITSAMQADPNSTKGRNLTNALRYASSLDEGVSKGILKKADFINKVSDLAKQSDAQGGVGLQSIFGAVQKTAAKVGNVAGFAAKGIADEASTAKRALISVLKEATPESLEALGVRLYNNYQQSAAPFVNQLQKAMSLPENRRTAILYGIYQQPAFRKMLRNIGQEVVGGELQAAELPMQGEQDENNNDVTMSDNVSEVDSKKKVENSREPQSVESSENELNLPSLEMPSLLKESEETDAVDRAASSPFISKRVEDFDKIKNLTKNTKDKEIIKQLQKFIGTSSDGYFYKKNGMSNSEKSLEVFNKIAENSTIDKVKEALNIQEELNAGMSKEEAKNDSIAKLESLMKSYNLQKINKLRPVLDLISKGEGTTQEIANKKGYDSPYDVTLGYGLYDPEPKDGTQKIPITNMTLKEIDDFQTGMLQNPKNKINSSAIGKYQIIRTTLRKLKKKLNLKDTDIFTPELQDKLALHLLFEKRKMNDFLLGNITSNQFQQELAKEWASIANPNTNKSYYGQATGVKNKEIQPILNSYVKKQE